MNRRAFLAATAAATAALAGCSNEPGDAGDRPECPPDPAVTPGASGWPSERGGPGNTGAVPADAVPGPPLSVDWTHVMGGFAGSPVPSVVDGTVYTSNLDQKVVAVDSDTGDPEWTRTVDDVETPPAVADGRAVVAARDRVVALSAADGDRLWSADLPASAAALVPGVQPAGDALLVPTDLSVVALDAATGEQRWAYEIGFPVDSTPAVAGDAAFVTSHDTYLHALDLGTGERRWWVKTDARSDCDPAVADGTVYFGNRDGAVVAVDAATGERRWTASLGERVESLAVNGGFVYAGGDDLVALDAATGEECWRADEYHQSYTGGVAASAEYLYGPTTGPRTSASTLAAFDPATGDRTWRFHGDVRVHNGPAIVDGAAYAGGVGQDGVLVARLS